MFNVNIRMEKDKHESKNKRQGGPYLQQSQPINVTWVKGEDQRQSWRDRVATQPDGVSRPEGHKRRQGWRLPKSTQPDGWLEVKIQRQSWCYMQQPQPDVRHWRSLNCAKDESRVHRPAFLRIKIFPARDCFHLQLALYGVSGERPTSKPRIWRSRALFNVYPKGEGQV
jgi:hypothetical protein